jgi:predicted enzyme related to lactoylglutathione lyase
MRTNIASTGGVMRFSGAMIGSDSPDALGAFYTKFLGEPGYQQDQWYGWASGAQLMIGPHSEVKGENETPQRIMLSLEVDDVKTAFDQATSFGARTIAEPYQPDGGNGMWLATLADPDGNYFQLATPWT